MRGLIALFLATVILTGLGVYRAVSTAAEEPEPTYELDSAVRRLPGTERADWMLRVALLSLARDDLLEAVLDATEVPLVTGEPIRLELGFQTQAWPPRLSENDGFGSIRQRRELPESFGQFSERILAEGVFHGRSEDVFLLTFRRFNHAYDGSKGSLPVSSLAMHAGVPIARVWPHRRLALFMVLLSTKDQGAEHEAGQLAYWRRLFRSAPADAVPDRSAIDAAVEALQPMQRSSGPLVSAVFGTYGSLMDAASAAYALRDYESAERVRGLLREDPLLVGRIAAAGIPRAGDSFPVSWRDSHDYPWFGALSVWLGVQPAEQTLRGDFSRVGLGDVSPPGVFDGVTDWRTQLMMTLHAPHLRTLEWSEDPVLLAELEDRLIKLSGYGNFPGLRQFAIDHERFGLNEEARAAWARVRPRFIDALGLPWSWFATRPFALLAYLLLLPCLAMVAALVPARRLEDAPGISPSGMITIAVLSVVTLGEMPLRLVLVPVWWILAWLWLRRLPAHPLWERLLVLLALSTASIDALHTVGWYPTGPLVEAMAGSALMFCWLFVGRMIVADPEWKRTNLLLVSLSVLCAMGWLEFVGGGPRVLAAVVSGGAFLLFLLENLKLGPSERTSPVTPG